MLPHPHFILKAVTVSLLLTMHQSHMCLSLFMHVHLSLLNCLLACHLLTFLYPLFYQYALIFFLVFSFL
jgi:hypothetical protein